MASTESLVLDILMKDSDAIAGMLNLAKTTDDAGNQVSSLNKKLTDLANRSVKARVGLDGADTTGTELDKLQLKLLDLSKKKADPEVDLGGYTKTLFEVDTLSRKLDDLGKKSTDINVGSGIFSHLLSSFTSGFQGGGGGIGGLASGLGELPLPASIPLGAGGGTAVAGVGTLILGYISSLVEAAIPTVIGGGVGALGALGVSKIRPGAFKDLTGALSQTFLGAVGQNQAVGAGAFAKGPGGITGQGPLGVTNTFLNGVLGIFKQIQQFLPTIGPELQNLFKASLPYLQTFVKVGEQAAQVMLPAMTQILKAMQPFLPEIGQGLVAIVKGFAAFLNDLGPSGMKVAAETFLVSGKAIGGVINGLGKAISFFAELFGVQVHAIRVSWDWLSQQLDAIVKHMVAAWDQFQHDTATIFDAIRHDLATVWDAIYKNTIGAVINIVEDVHKWDVNMRHDIAGDYDNIRHDIAGAWDTIWNNTVGRVKTGIGDVVGLFQRLPGDVVNALLGLGTKLWNLGHTWLTDLWNGIKSVWNSVLHFFSNIPGDILHALGIHSPPDWAINAGKNIMEGLHLGMGGTLDKVLGVTGTLGHLITSGISNIIHGGIPVPRGAGGSVEQLMRAMAAAIGWSGTQWDALYNVEMREAGFNLHARNPSSGAYGLAQFINGPAEYAQYGGNALTAVGQITGMLNYIKQRYGNPIAAWEHEQSAGWYGTGFHGIVNRPTIFGAGERGTERVDITPGGSGGRSRNGALLNVQGDLYLREPADAVRVTSRLDAMIRASWSG